MAIIREYFIALNLNFKKLQNDTGKLSKVWESAMICSVIITNLLIVS